MFFLGVRLKLFNLGSWWLQDGRPKTRVPTHRNKWNWPCLSLCLWMRIQLSDTSLVCLSTAVLLTLKTIVDPYETICKSPIKCFLLQKKRKPWLGCLVTVIEQWLTLLLCPLDPSSCCGLHPPKQLSTIQNNHQNYFGNLYIVKSSSHLHPLFPYITCCPINLFPVQ